MADTTTRDAKVVQYLNEAYGKEKQLETALQAHIAMTTRAPYKKRRQEHLRETKDHARQLERRIKQLGASADGGNIPVPEAVGDAVQNVANRAAALAQGPLHALRGTSEPEKMLKNAKTQFQDEAEEIATYTAIEALAESVGDKDTAKIAKSIRREEERMRDFLLRQIPQLTKAVATAEIPAKERRTSTRRRSSSRSRSTSRTSGSSSRSRSSSRSSSGRSTSSRSRSTSGRSTSGRSTSGRSTSSRSRSTSGRSTSSRSRSTSGSGGTRRTSSAGRSASSRSSASSSRSGSSSRGRRAASGSRRGSSNGGSPTRARSRSRS